MREMRDTDSPPVPGSRGVVRTLTLLLLAGLVWLAAGGAITKDVKRHRADLGGDIRAVTCWGFWSIRLVDPEGDDLGAAFTDIRRRITERETVYFGYFPEEERADELAWIRQRRRRAPAPEREGAARGARR